MKKIFLTIALLFGLIITPTYAANFTDDFNDGNADGWINGTNCSSPGWCRFGNYRVVDNQVTNDEGGDGQLFLAQDYPVTNHTVEAKVLWHDNGYTGLAVWYLNDDNWVTIGYPLQNRIVVGEKWCYGPELCGRDENVISTTYPHPFTTRTMQTMKVVANSLTGELSVYLDGEYLFTHTVGPSTHREGLSGFMSGNAGGTFDDFKLIDLSYPTHMDQCKNDGWETFNNPVFKNQGNCVSFVQSNPNAVSNKK
jgi:hypothetical protein